MKKDSLILWGLLTAIVIIVIGFMIMIGLFMSGGWDKV